MPQMIPKLPPTIWLDIQQGNFNIARGAAEGYFKVTMLNILPSGLCFRGTKGLKDKINIGLVLFNYKLLLTCF